MKKIKHIKPRKAEIIFYSTVTGSAHEELLDNYYWVKNLCCPVLFSPAIESLINAGHNFLLELGPHATLVPMIARIKDHVYVSTTKSTTKSTTIVESSLRKGPKSDLQPLRALAQFCAHDGKLAGDFLEQAKLAQMLLPFAFDRKRYWLETADRYQEKRARERPLLSKKLAGPVPAWESIIETHHAHHMESVLCGQENSWVTNGILIEMAVEALEETFPHAGAFRLVDSKISRALKIPEKEHPRLRIIIREEHITIFSLTNIKAQIWEENFSCRFSIQNHESSHVLGKVHLPDYIQEKNKLSSEHIYSHLAEINYDVGVCLRVIEHGFKASNKNLLIGINKNLSKNNYCLNPLIYEAIEQSIIYFCNQEDVKICGFEQIDLPTNFDSNEASSILLVRRNDRLHVYLLNSHGNVLLSAYGAIFEDIPKAKEQGIPKDTESWIFDDQWSPVSLPKSAGEPLDTLLIFAKNSPQVIKFTPAINNVKARRIITVFWGDFARYEDVFTINPHKQEDYDQLFNEISALGIGNLVVLHMGSWDSAEDVISSQEYSSASILRILKSQALTPSIKLAGFFFVSKAAQPALSQSNDLTGLYHATVWGMLRTLDIELPEIPFWRVDLDDDAPNSFAHLMALVALRPKEREFIIRKSGLWTYHMIKSTRTLASKPRLGPALNDVEIAVDQTCFMIGSGIITALGRSVDNKKFERGMRVIFPVRKKQEPDVLIDSNLVITVPSNFCLNNFDRICKIIQLIKIEAALTSHDQLMLIDSDEFDSHVAINYCEHINAQKPYVVKSTSRYEDFEDYANIEDKSVSTIISLGVSCDLNRFARYLCDDAKIVNFDASGLKPALPIIGINYRQVTPTYLQDRLECFFSQIAADALKLLPSLKLEPVLPQARAVQKPARGLFYDPQGVYILSGGTGGLGLELAKRMARNGAGNLILLSRRGMTHDVEADIQCIKNFGARVSVLSLDITKKDDVDTLFRNLKVQGKPIRGVVHAAGTLKNGLVQKLSPRELIEPMRAKILGALNLHNATMGMNLDFFLLFSSLSSQIGSRGQANYASGNAFLDALANYRVNNNLPGLSISWGPWSEKGMAVTELNQARLSKVGIGFVDLTQGLNILESALIQKEQGHFSVLPMDWGRYSTVFTEAQNQRFLEKIMPHSSHDKTLRNNSFSLNTYARCNNRDDRVDLLIELIKTAVSRCFKVDEILYPDTEIGALGLDSIISLELKSRIDNALGTPIDTALLLRGPAIKTLAQHCFEKLEHLLHGQESPQNKGSLPC